MEVGEVATYIFDHFGNVIFLVAAVGTGAKWVWSRVKGEIQFANNSVVTELKGMREDFQKMATAQGHADGKIAVLDKEVSEIKGTVTTLVTALSGVLVLRETHKE